MVDIDKTTEVVPPRNVFDITMAIFDWPICGLFGPNQIRFIPLQVDINTWNNTLVDDAALCNTSSLLSLIDRTSYGR